MLPVFEKFKVRYEILIFIVLLSLGALVRFYALGSVPAGLNQDEASMGYDAYALLHYGVDRNGMHNPVHMIAWGSGQNALQAYATIPFIALFDLSVFSIRLVPALFGVLSLVLFYWVARKIAGRRLALVALFILAISPWHIVLSRWALESNFLPGMILIAIALLFYAQQNPRFLFLPFAFFALSLYAYSTAYAFVPLFLFFYGMYSLYKKIYSVKEWFFACAVFALLATPIALFMVVNLFKLNSIDAGLFSIPRMPGEARYTHMTSFFSQEFLQELIKNFHRVIEIIFLQFNDRETQSSVKDIGVAYAFSLPFLVLGLILFVRDCMREKGISFRIPIILWLVVSFGVAILSWPAVHRMNLVFFPLIIMVAYGVYAVWRKSNIVFIGIVIVYSLLFFRFEKIYFTEYADEVGNFFFESYTDAVSYAYIHSNSAHTLYLSDNLNQPYIHVLFATRYDVRDYIASVDIPNRTDAFQIVKSFGRFIFGVQTKQASTGKVVVARNDEVWQFPPDRYISKAFKNYTALFNRDHYVMGVDGNPIAQSSRFELINPLVVDSQLVIIKPHIINDVVELSVQSFYFPGEIQYPAFEIKGNRLLIASVSLPVGISKLSIVGKVADSQDLVQTFVIFKPSENEILLDPDMLQGNQSFGVLEKNRGFEGNEFIDGGTVIPWGFGTHADSAYTYNLSGMMDSLMITAAISQASGNCGDGAVFEIFGDGRLLVDANLEVAETRKITVHLQGVSILEFRTYMKGSPHCDHTNWMAPVFRKSN